MRLRSVMLVMIVAFAVASTSPALCELVCAGNTHRVHSSAADGHAHGHGTDHGNPGPSLRDATTHTCQHADALGISTAPPRGILLPALSATLVSARKPTPANLPALSGLLASTHTPPGFLAPPSTILRI